MNRHICILAAALSIGLSAPPSHADKIGSKDIEKDAVRGRHIKNHSVNRKDLSARLVRKLLSDSFEFMDATGQVIGPAMTTNTTLVEVTSTNMLVTGAEMASVGDYLGIHVLKDGIGPWDGLIYLGENCTGAVLTRELHGLPSVFPFTNNGPHPASGKLTGFLPDPSAVPGGADGKSTYGSRPDGTLGCYNSNNSILGGMVPAVPVIDLSAYLPPIKGQKAK